MGILGRLTSMLRFPSNQGQPQRSDHVVPDSPPTQPSPQTSKPVRQSATKNFTRFGIVFGIPSKSGKVVRHSATASAGRRSVSTASVSIPLANSATTWKVITEPDPKELIDEVEALTRNAIPTSYDAQLAKAQQYSQTSGTDTEKLNALLADIKAIDDRANVAIGNMRLTVYDTVRDAKAASGQAQERDLSERLRQLPQTTPRHIQNEATKIRNELAQESESELHKTRFQTIGRFNDRVKGEVLVGRHREIKEACVKHLMKDAQNNIPESPLYELVKEIMPDALVIFDGPVTKEFTDEIYDNATSPALHKFMNRQLLGDIPDDQYSHPPTA